MSAIIQKVKLADRYVRANLKWLLPIYLLIELVLLGINMISQQLVAIVLGIAMVTISHAYIVTALKIVDNKENSIHFRDAFVGFRDFVKLFPSYIMRKVSLNFLSFLLLLPMVAFIRFQCGFSLAEFLDWVRIIVVNGINDPASLSIVQGYLTSLPLVISLLIADVVTSICSYGLAMMPYLVEEYDISWNEAIMKSWKMMKGQKRYLLMLRMCYLPRILLVYVVMLIVISLFSFSQFLATLFSLSISLYMGLLIYLPQVEIATCLFYKELIRKDRGLEMFRL